MIYEFGTVCELHIIRGSWGVYTSPRPVRLVRLVRVVKQWLTSRTVCELHIIRGSWGVYTSPRPVRLVRLVRVVKQWLTSRTVCELRISHLFRETTIRLLDLNCTRYHNHSFYVFHTLLLNIINTRLYDEESVMV